MSLPSDREECFFESLNHSSLLRISVPLQNKMAMLQKKTGEENAQISTMENMAEVHKEDPCYTPVICQEAMCHGLDRQCREKDVIGLAGL